MKKYIILILVLLLHVNKVYAGELIDIGYNYIDDASNYYYDKNDFIKNYSEWQEYNGEELENMEIKTFYKYNKILPVRYIHIYDGGINIDELKISELKVFNGLDEISYEKECIKCNEDTLDYINDNNYEFDKQFKMNYVYGYLTIDLLNEYELENLIIKIYINDESAYIKKYHIGFSTTKEKNNFITTKYFKEDVYSYKKNVMFEYKVDDKWNINYDYVSEYESDKLIENNIFYNKLSEQQMYRTFDLKYKTYILDNENINNSLENENKESTTIEKNTSITNIQPIKVTVNKSNIETKNIEKETGSTIKSVDTKTTHKIDNYKTITNKSNSKIFCIIYIIIIINILTMIILINMKKMSYEK